MSASRRAGKQPPPSSHSASSSPLMSRSMYLQHHHQGADYVAAGGKFVVRTSAVDVDGPPADGHRFRNGAIFANDVTFLVALCLGTIAY